MTGNPEVMLDTSAKGACLTEIETAIVSSRSKCTRAIEITCVCRLAFHNEREDVETDSATQRFAPQPSAPTRYHAVCCALHAGAGCARHAWRDECFPRRKPDHPARSQGDSVAFHVAPGAVESRQAMPKLVLNRDSGLLSSVWPTECPDHHRSSGAYCHSWLGPSDSVLFAAPQTARTEQLSTTACDQSIWSSRESQSNNAK